MSISSKTLLILSIFITFAYSFHVSAEKVQKLDVTVNEVVGDVEIMLPNTFEWVPVPQEGGSIFTEGVQIRTGPFSSMSLVFADSSVVYLDSFTFMTVEKFFKSGDVVTTRINLIIGSIVNTLNEGTPYENDYKVATPSFTTSLNGGEIKKIVSGAMFRDTERTGPREDVNSQGEKTVFGRQNSAGGIAREQQRRRESSVSVTPLSN